MIFLSDTLRTRLRDIVFGRTRISVVSKDQLAISSSSPIFVIGTFRSGTTLLRYLLDSHSNICCPPETKFLVDLARLFQEKENRTAFDCMGFEDCFVLEQCQNFANNFYDAYRISTNKPRWADKTPEYVRILPFIEEMYGPDCQYVIIYRNGLDVAHSMYSTPIKPIEDGKTLEKAFVYWLHDTEIIKNWVDKHKKRCFVIHYEKLCHDLEFTLKGLFNFLNEPWENEVLQWYTKKHDRGAEDIKARRQRKINISHGNFNVWELSVAEDFKRRSKELHEAIGYDPETLLPL